MLAMLGRNALRVAARGSGPGFAAFDRLRALRSFDFEGTGRGTGLPVRTRNWIKGRGPEGHSFTGWLCTSRETGRKRLSEGEPLSDFTACIN